MTTTIPNVFTPSILGLELHVLQGDQAWYLIACDEPEATLNEVCDTLGSAEVPYQRCSAQSPEALLRQGRDTKVVACVPVDTWDWDDAAYARLDYLRWRIREAWSVLVWVAPPPAVRQLIHLAPNFAAFFQPSVGSWSSGTMPTSDAEAHLAALRKQYELSDEDVIAMAMQGKMPADADYQLWLILLGRGDLIPRTTPQ